jgi:hypothetical protein
MHSPAEFGQVIQHRLNRWPDFVSEVVLDVPDCTTEVSAKDDACVFKFPKIFSQDLL